MRKIVLNMQVSADGFFCGPHNEMNWMSQVPDEELNNDIVSFLTKISEGFMGYQAANEAIPFWRQMTQNPNASKDVLAIAEAVNNMHPYIVSNKEEDLPWDNAKLLLANNDDELVKKIRKIQEQPGDDLGVAGGIRTAQRFIRLGLIDKYMLTIQPIALGEGKRIFTQKVNLELISAKTYRSGVMRVLYRQIK